MERETNTMIETTSDAMTAEELVSESRALCSTIGHRVRAAIVVSTETYSTNDAVSFIISDCNHKQLGHFQASSFAAAFAAAREWASTHKAVRRNAIVRRMALAVLEITDEHGTCTDTLLRGKDFTAGEIVEFHEAACVRAGEMAGNSPFVVVFATETV